MQSVGDVSHNRRPSRQFQAFRAEGEPGKLRVGEQQQRALQKPSQGKPNRVLASEFFGDVCAKPCGTQDGRPVRDVAFTEGI